MAGQDSSFKRLFFLHIPKAAGTTFYDILYRNYPHRTIAKIDGTLPVESAKEICQWLPEKKKKIQVVMGHMLYGMHMHFPGEYTYITFLRDPVKRVLSLYNHIMTVPQHPLHKKAIERKLTLSSFVDEGFTSELSNDQVRRISGCNVEEIGEKQFETAKEKLEVEFSFVGITEYFDESLVLLEKDFTKWTHFNYTRQNVGQQLGKQERESELPIVLDKMRECNIWDIKLYEFAKEQFDKSIRSYGVSSFNENIEEFRKNNDLFTTRERKFSMPLSIYRKIRNKMCSMGFGSF